jgi:hypothetical protein
MPKRSALSPQPNLVIRRLICSSPIIAGDGHAGSSATRPGVSVIHVVGPGADTTHPGAAGAD